MSLSMVSTSVSMPYLPIRSISATRSIGAIRTNKDASWLKGTNLIKPSIPLLPFKSEKLVRNDERSFKVCMSRRSSAEEKKIASDPVYHNRLVTMLVNRLLKNGKKSLAYLIIYDALKRIQQKTEKNPLLILRQAIDGVTPDVTVKSRRVGGSTQQVPVEVGMAQGKALAIRWLLKAARKRPGRSMVFKLSSEILDAARGSGEAIRKREETHKMAEANRAFARFR